MPTATGPLGRAWISSLAALLAGGPAMAVESVDDPVSGSCKALVRQQGSTGVHGRTGTWPGLWGVTEPVLYIGDKRTDEAGVTDGIDADLTERVVPATRGRPAASCASVKNFRYAFRTETRVTAMQWQHGRKPDSACAKEWDRMRGIIRTHELKHVKDVDDTIRDENTRIAAIRPIEACAATADAAKAKAGVAVRSMLVAQVARLKAALDAKAKVRDREKLYIDCTKCDDRKIAFRDVTLTCTIAAPTCEVTTGRVIAGEVCGDPTTTLWKMTPQNWVRGCGIPGGGATPDKPFDNDCVEAGSDIEKQRIATYRSFRDSGAGGWMCVYDAQTEQVTIRSFRPRMCKGDAEQHITVKAETSSCDP